jgi:hypothetical protein
LVLVHGIDPTEVSVALERQLAGSVPSFVVVLDGSSSEASSGSDIVLGAPSDGLLSVVDRVAASVSRQYRVSFALPQPLPAAAEIIVTDGAATVQVPVSLRPRGASHGEPAIGVEVEAGNAPPAPPRADRATDPPDTVVGSAADDVVTSSPLRDTRVEALKRDPATDTKVGSAPSSQSWWILAAPVLIAALLLITTSLYRATVRAADRGGRR